MFRSWFGLPESGLRNLPRKRERERESRSSLACIQDHDYVMVIVMIMIVEKTISFESNFLAYLTNRWRRCWFELPSHQLILSGRWKIFNTIRLTCWQERNRSLNKLDCMSRIIVLASRPKRDSAQVSVERKTSYCQYNESVIAEIECGSIRLIRTVLSSDQSLNV